MFVQTCFRWSLRVMCYVCVNFVGNEGKLRGFRTNGKFQACSQMTSSACLLSVHALVRLFPLVTGGIALLWVTKKHWGMLVIRIDELPGLRLTLPLCPSAVFWFFRCNSHMSRCNKSSTLLLLLCLPQVSLRIVENSACHTGETCLCMMSPWLAWKKRKRFMQKQSWCLETASILQVGHALSKVKNFELTEFSLKYNSSSFGQETFWTRTRTSVGIANRFHLVIQFFPFWWGKSRIEQIIINRKFKNKSLQMDSKKVLNFTVNWSKFEIKRIPLRFLSCIWFDRAVSGFGATHLSSRHAGREVQESGWLHFFSAPRKVSEIQVCGYLCLTEARWPTVVHTTYLPVFCWNGKLRTVFSWVLFHGRTGASHGGLGPKQTFQVGTFHQNADVIWEIPRNWIELQKKGSY